MNAMFALPIDSETLTGEELQQISGCARRNDQISWLDSAGWTYVRNRAGEPIVGRMYARLKLAGINPGVLPQAGAWDLDVRTIR